MTASLLSATPHTPDTAAVAQFWSMSARIGRLRYFCYTLFAMLGLAVGLVVIYLLCLLLPTPLASIISSASFILAKNLLIPLVVFVMSIRRLHDLDLSGWWSLAVLIPFATLLLLVLQGKPVPNRFGPPPADNRPALTWSALLLPVAVIGLYLFLVEINPPRDAGSAPTPVLRPYPGA